MKWFLLIARTTACVFFLALGLPSLHAETLGSRVLLLGIENVRNELNLTGAQRNTLDKLRSAYREAARQAAAQRTPAAQDELLQTTKRFDEKALGTLTSTQRTRLNKILHQIHGTWMLTSPAVQTQLGLSAGQVASIERRLEQFEVFTDKTNALAYEGKISNQERVLRLRNYRLRQAESMERLLTKEQRATINSIQQGACVCQPLSTCDCPPGSCPADCS